jgi:hypothetical protein
VTWLLGWLGCGSPTRNPTSKTSTPKNTQNHYGTHRGIFAPLARGWPRLKTASLALFARRWRFADEVPLTAAEFRRWSTDPSHHLTVQLDSG